MQESKIEIFPKGPGRVSRSFSHCCLDRIPLRLSIILISTLHICAFTTVLVLGFYRYPYDGYVCRNATIHETKTTTFILSFITVFSAFSLIICFSAIYAVFRFNTICIKIFMLLQGFCLIPLGLFIYFFFNFTFLGRCSLCIIF